MSFTNTPELSGTKIHTTRWREWLGWFGAMAWYLCMINTWEDFAIVEDTVAYAFAFQAVLALSVIIIGFLYGRNPNRLGKLAFYTMPAAIVMTAAFPFLPPPYCSLLFTLSPLFMAPVMVRRIYGIIKTSSPDKTLWTYMSCNAAAFGFMLVFNHMVIPDGFLKITDSEPVELFFCITAILPVLAWLEVRRKVSEIGQTSGETRLKFSKPLLFGLVAVVLVAFWMRVINNLIDWNVEHYDHIIGVPVYIVLPVLAFLLFGYLGDKGHERKSILAGLILFLVSVQLAFFLVVHDETLLAIPLVAVNHFVHFYIMYFILTVTLNFIPYTKRPVFMVSLSFGLYLISRLFTKITEVVLPQSMQEPGVPLFVTAAITALVFFLLLYFVFQRHRDKTLAAALYALVHSGAGSLKPSPLNEALDGETTTPETREAAETQIMINAGLTPDETKVALLLIEGQTRSEILRKLHISAAEVGQRENAIRHKLIGMSGPDPVIAAIATEYNLTKREVEMLSFLNREAAGNDEIAAQLYLSEETVKSHMRSLMKKLPVDKRQEVPAWIARYGSEGK